jgi:hypothetical protein
MFAGMMFPFRSGERGTSKRLPRRNSPQQPFAHRLIGQAS